MSEPKPKSTSARGAAVKTKQKVIMVGVVAGFAALALAAAFVSHNSASQAPAAPAKAAETANLVTGASAYNDRDAWRVQLASDMTALQSALKESQARQEKLEKELTAARARASAAPTSPPPPLQAEPTGSSPAGSNALNLPPPPVRPPSGSTGSPPNPRPASPATPPPSFQTLPSFSAGAFDPPVPPTRTEPGKPASASITTITFDNPTPAGSAGAGATRPNAVEATSGTAERQPAGTYIPAGSFVRVLVLNGLDAPTGGQAQNNPSPVLLRVMDHATMPNGYKVDLKGCTLTGNGFGDIASERANVRLDRLSCVFPDGTAIDLAVRGYVAGEDGKAGMRGKIVAKTGQMLANALFASVGSGIGEAARSAAVTTTTGALGNVTTTPNAGQGFQAGLGAGTQRAFDMLAKYYISLAERTFPVVEVNGGRMADVVFSRGFTLEGR
jgi:conjugal transfer pilus assembly protein TraB